MVPKVRIHVEDASEDTIQYDKGMMPSGAIMKNSDVSTMSTLKITIFLTIPEASLLLRLKKWASSYFYEKMFYCRTSVLPSTCKQLSNLLGCLQI